MTNLFAVVPAWAWIALAAMNLIAFTAYGVDKAKARSGAWRIPERTLLLLAFLGGAAGAWLGMGVFRHKTQKTKFRLLVPLAFFLWLGALVFLALRLG